MTGPEHYTAAEQHAAAAQEVTDPEAAAFFLRLAGVHATLAVAAATALNSADGGLSYEDDRAWRQAAGITD